MSFAQAYLGGIPAFTTYFLGALAYMAAFGAIYTAVTRHKEVELIRQGNLAAAAALLGALGGFALPLSKSVAQSANLVDFAIWATVALVVQLGAYALACALARDVTRKINEGQVATGLWLGGTALIFGVLNAASMTYGG